MRDQRMGIISAGFEWVRNSVFSPRIPVQLKHITYESDGTAKTVRYVGMHSHAGAWERGLFNVRCSMFKLITACELIVHAVKNFADETRQSFTGLLDIVFFWHFCSEIQD